MIKKREEVRFSTLLKKTDKAIQGDKLNFECLKKGHISVQECWNQFLKNNGHDPERYVFNDRVRNLFLRWLRSLGWFIKYTD